MNTRPKGMMPEPRQDKLPERRQNAPEEFDKDFGATPKPFIGSWRLIVRNQPSSWSAERRLHEKFGDAAPSFGPLRNGSKSLPTPFTFFSEEARNGPGSGGGEPVEAALDPEQGETSGQ